MLSLLRSLLRGWMVFSRALGIVMSVIILTILWIVGFGLYAIVLRALSLRKMFQKEPETYWVDAQPETPESMRYPF